MYFQRVCVGAAVWKTASIDCGTSIAKRLPLASGARGAGASASSRALVPVSNAIKEPNTTRLRRCLVTGCVLGGSFAGFGGHLHGPGGGSWPRGPIKGAAALVLLHRQLDEN